MTNSTDLWETLVQEHYASLYRFAFSLTRDETEAQDLTQETFYIWATKGHQLRDPGKAKTWLYTTLHRAFLHGRRRTTKYTHQSLEEAAEQGVTLTAEQVDPSDWGQVLTALARVDATYQAAVALFYLEDCSYREIAAILGVPIGTVKSRIARGVAQLRALLGPGAPANAFSGPGPTHPASSEPTATLEDSSEDTPEAQPRNFSSSRVQEPDLAAGLSWGEWWGEAGLAAS